MWGANPQAFQTIYLRQDFSLDWRSSGTLQTSLSGDGDVYLDGDLIRHDADGVASGVVQDTIGSVPAGQNAIAIKATDVTGLCQWVQAYLNVTASKAIPTVTWSNPADITYGTPLGPTQLDATATDPTSGAAVPGTFTYTPAAGTVLNAGQGQQLQVSFTPKDDTAYTATTASVTVNVGKATPTLTWANPADITYGTPLGSAQLDATTAVNGTFAYTPAAGTVLDAGANQTLLVTFTPSDTANYTSASASVTINVGKTSLTVTPDNLTKQYSDPVPTLTGTLTGVQNHDPISVAYATTATLTSAPGTYPITATLADPSNRLGNYTVAVNAGTLTVAQEDARATYTGALFVSTAATTSSTATVTLSATIQDISAVTGDPAFDSSPGDIRHATVSFVDRESGVTLCTPPIGLVNLADARTGTVTCNWTTNIGTADGAQYDVGIVVGGYYMRDSSADDALVTVAKPFASNVIRGSGYLVLAHSAGQIPGDTGSRARFSFVVRYSKSGAPTSGSGSLIVTSGGRTYRIRGTAVTSLSVNKMTHIATLNANATIQDVTNPRKPVTVDSNASVQVTMTDNGTGTGDTVGATVWNKSGGLWFSSNWNSTTTLEQKLGSGNLIVS